MKNVKYVNRGEFVEMVKDPKFYSGCNLMGYDALTEEKLTGGKKNPMQGRVRKIHSRFLSMVFDNKVKNSYEAMVNRRLEQMGEEPTFSAGSLPWGTKIEGTACIEHKGNYYLQTIQFQTAEKLDEFCERTGIKFSEKDEELLSLMKEKVAGYQTPFGSVEYLLDNEVIDKSEIEGLPTKKTEGKQGGLSDNFKVIVRAFKIESLKRATIGGTTYMIVD